MGNAAGGVKGMFTPVAGRIGGAGGGRVSLLVSACAEEILCSPSKWIVRDLMHCASLHFAEGGADSYDGEPAASRPEATATPAGIDASWHIGGRGVFRICRLGYHFPCLGAACAIGGPHNIIKDWTCFFPIGWQTSFDEPCHISFVFIYQAV